LPFSSSCRAELDDTVVVVLIVVAALSFLFGGILIFWRRNWLMIGGALSLFLLGWVAFAAMMNISWDGANCQQGEYPDAHRDDRA
jgi:ABC-type uncharacterized transport system permease subunit